MGDTGGGGFPTMGLLAEPGAQPAQQDVPSPAFRAKLIRGGKKRFLVKKKQPNEHDVPSWQVARERV